jgi:retron-type reverse transcriptase
MEKVVERSCMLRATGRRVEQNKGAAGVDGVEIKILRPYLKEHWPSIGEELLR